jgi:hypothetical protein
MPKVGLELFHVSTDETISDRQTRSLEYAEHLSAIHSVETQRIVLIDNYNAGGRSLAVEEVLGYLKNRDMLPEYWAYEADLVANAQKVLNALTDGRLRRANERYIDNNRRFPCSLLTASWYLTRLGSLTSDGVIRGVNGDRYSRPEVLLNILPEDYREVEERALALIHNSEFAGEAERIYGWFYSTAVVSQKRTSLRW